MFLQKSSTKLVGVVIIVVIAFFVTAMVLVRFVTKQQYATTGSAGVPMTSVSMLGSGAGYDSFGLADVAVEKAMYAEESGARQMMPPIEPPSPGYSSGWTDDMIPETRLIIKTGNMEIIVDDVPIAIQAVVDYVAANGGFEVNRNIYKNGKNSFSGSVTVRIPSSLFEASLAEARKLGEVTHQEVNGQDVTEEFVDIQAQLKNLRASEAQFLDIMKRATKIEDVLAVQRELTNIRSQIERLEGRSKYLEQSAKLSTLTVNFYTDPAEVPIIDDDDEWRPIAVVKDALRSLLNLGKVIVAGLIWFVIYIPLWLLIALVTWGVYRVITRRQRQNQ